MVKNTPAMWIKPGFDPWDGKIPWRRVWQPTPVFLPGASPGTHESGGLQFMQSQRAGHDWGAERNTAHVLSISIIIMVNHLRRAPHAHHSPLSVPEILALPSSSLLLLLLLPPPLLFPNYLDQRQHQATTPITAKTFLSGVSLIQCPRQGESSKPVLSYQPDMSY